MLPRIASSSDLVVAGDKPVDEVSYCDEGQTVADNGADVTVVESIPSLAASNFVELWMLP